MTREESWGIAGTTMTLLRHISGLGYVVSVHRLTGSLRGHWPATVEMHAIFPGEDHQHIAQIEAEEPEAEYRCACALAELIGVDLEG